ncbi:MAG: pyruvate kinase [Candidatus Flexifilum sp.]|jgi:pyruvate kinase
MYKKRINGKRTKIVATIGPASRDEAVLRQLIRNGIDVARINFSHGTHEIHGETIDRIRRIADEEDALVAILCDIQGPKIRLGQIRNEEIPVQVGDTVTLTLDPADGTDNVVQIPHPEFVSDIKVGTRLLLGDGDVELLVTATTGRTLTTSVVRGTVIQQRKGVMAPNARLSLNVITDKDREDVLFALSKQTDYIAMSFVRSADDLREMRWLIRHSGGNAGLIAKIEKHEALECIEEIIDVADGVMVARGDLGLELSPEDVPYHQKRIIQLANQAGKPVITATEMLKSMETSSRPTRAEASDVYNAILDGTDAVMLSGETASGQYPAEAVEMMANIASMAERHLHLYARNLSGTAYKPLAGTESISDAVSWATVNVADTLNCKSIITTTMTGYTTRRVARERPRTPIICVTPHETTYRRMALVWGVHPIHVPMFNSIDEMMGIVVRAAYNHNLVHRGDSIVIIAGVPFGNSGQTNFLKIHTVGENNELD